MNAVSNIIFTCFTHEQVKEINKEVKKNIKSEQNPEESAQNVNKIGKFCQVPCMSLMELLHPWLYQCQLINRHHFGYDVDWNLHLDKFNYNVYGESGEYDWHVDAMTKENHPLDQKLTCILNLSEEQYEGGDFYLTYKNEKENFNSGQAIVFTSLIAHKVTPVTNGERITLTYWGMAPAWR